MGENGRKTYDSDIAEKAKASLATKLRDLIDDPHALADHLGCSVQAINQYKQGIAYPKMENLIKIAAFYGVSLDYLCGLSPARSPDANIQAAVKALGLSEGAVDFLMSLNAEGRYYQDQRKALSLLLETLLDERQGQSHDVVSFGDGRAYLSECRKAVEVSAAPSWDDSVFQKERELKKLGRYSMGSEAYATAIIECEAVARFRKLARFVVFGRDE